MRNNPVLGIICLVIALGLTAFMGVRANFFGMAICGFVTALIAVDVVRRNKKKA